MKCKAIIRVYNGGKWGKMSEYIAIIEPKFFKNGNMKKSDFREIEILETLQKGYKYHTANCSATIYKVLETIE